MTPIATAPTSQDAALEGVTRGAAPVDAGAHGAETQPGSDDTPTEPPPEEQLISARARPPGSPGDAPSVAINETGVSYPSSSPAALGAITRDPASLQLPNIAAGTPAQGEELTTGSIAAAEGRRRSKSH